MTRAQAGPKTGRLHFGERSYLGHDCGELLMDGGRRIRKRGDHVIGHYGRRIAGKVEETPGL